MARGDPGERLQLLAGSVTRQDSAGIEERVRSSRCRAAPRRWPPPVEWPTRRSGASGREGQRRSSGSLPIDGRQADQNGRFSPRGNDGLGGGRGRSSLAQYLLSRCSAIARSVKTCWCAPNCSLYGDAQPFYFSMPFGNRRHLPLRNGILRSIATWSISSILSPLAALSGAPAFIDSIRSLILL